MYYVQSCNAKNTTKGRKKDDRIFKNRICYKHANSVNIFLSYALYAPRQNEKFSLTCA